jgi:hypothetical protein
MCVRWRINNASRSEIISTRLKGLFQLKILKKRFMAYIYTPFMKKVLHITERKRKSNVQHYCKSDDFRAGFKVAEWRMFCHSAWLQISPARFKQV